MDFWNNISFGEFQWVEILYAAVGSFIGIFVTLWIDKSKNRKEAKEARDKLLSSLNRELESVRLLIEEYERPEHQYDIFSFSTFVWDSIIAAGMLTDMLSDEDIQCPLLMEIYSDLSLLEELNDEFCQCAQAEDLRSIYESVVAKRKEIYDKIVRYQTPADTN